MKNYAIVQSGGKQYRVSEGSEILVDNLSVDRGSEYTFPHVLMLRTDEDIHLGTPYIEGSRVVGKVVDELKGTKIHIAKFKAKVHYRRRMGFRAKLSKVLIEKIKFTPYKSTAPKKKAS